MVAAQHCECTKCHLVVHFKMVNLTLREFHLNFLKSHPKLWVFLSFILENILGK